MPMIVVPSGAVNSFGGYDASVPNTILPSAATLCGTFAASASSLVGAGSGAASGGARGRRSGGRAAAVAARPAPGEDGGERSTGERGGECAGERHGCNLLRAVWYAGMLPLSAASGPLLCMGCYLAMRSTRDVFPASRSSADCAGTAGGNRNPARPTRRWRDNPANTEDILRCRSSRTWPRWPPPSRPAAGTRASNPDKAAKYVDQAAAFVDKQTKGKYSGQIHGVVGKVKSAAGLPRPGTATQAYDANAGYGKHQGYGATRCAGPADRHARRPRRRPRPAGHRLDGDDRVDHRAARLHPAHAVDGRPRAPGDSTSRAARTSDRAHPAKRHRLLPRRTAVVPR